MEKVYLPFRGKVSKEALVQEIEGEAVLLHLSNEQYFGLNKIGTRVWNLLAEFGDSNEVASRIRQEYDVDEKTLNKDLSVLIEELVEKGLFIIEK